MREILFRGKREDNGEWVIGFLSKTRGLDKKLHICIDYEEKGLMCSSIVIPETVGQYTGLTDKNGNKIFEGDICLCNRNISHYIDKLAFEIKYDNICFFIGESLTGEIIHADEFEWCEIIGNTHENPKLLSYS